MSNLPFSSGKFSGTWPAVTRAGSWLIRWFFAALSLLHAQALPGDTRVYRIGTDNSYPYHRLTATGEPEGMAGEVIHEASRRAGIALKWEVHMEGPGKALANRSVDLWPLFAVDPKAWPQLHFTAPYMTNTYIGLFVNPALARLEAASSVRRFSVINYPIVKRVAQNAYPQATSVPTQTRADAFVLLCEGKVDSMVTEARTAQSLVLNRPQPCANVPIATVGIDTPPIQLGLTSIQESAEVADRLRTEIDRMLADGSMPKILGRWNYFYSGEAETIYRAAEAQNARTLSMRLSAVLGIFAILLLFMLVRMRAARKAADAANEAKSQFLASISHEIRTPLHGILGMTHILADSDLTPPQRESVDLLVASGKTLLAIVNDLLDLARMERGQFHLNLAPANLPEVIRGTVNVFQPDARLKNLQLECKGIQSLPELVNIDAARIRQILSNLLGNALKFTSKGSVTVAVSCESIEGIPWMSVSVTDTGIGISKESRRKLFQKFSQAESSIARRFGGTGLGLAIAKELVVAMGGSIGVESEFGQGASFWFRTPLDVRMAVDAPPAPAVAPAPTPAKDAPPAKPINVLLVEDNPVNKKIAVRMLEKAGCQVIAATDGESALREWERQTFQAIFMDCQMPGIDGYQATMEIRKRESHGHHIPIIALTASAMNGERERCLESGMDDYLTKPIDLLELDRVLNRWVKPGVKVC